MERTIYVTVDVDDATENASIFFCEGDSGDHFRMTEVAELNDDAAKRAGWEILGWIENMRDDLAWRRENEKEA